MNHLGIEDPGLAHNDPDLDELARPRQDGWRPMFGQAESASKHLMNQGVGVGDCFLFFGRFRPTVATPNGPKFAGSPLHVLWGFLEVAEIRDPVADPAPPKWALEHPHYACTAMPWFQKNNRVFIGKSGSALGGSHGAGRFGVYRDELRLSAPNGPMSKWHLPMDFHPDAAGALMSNTSLNEWGIDGPSASLQVIGQRQEFVLQMTPAIEAWVRATIAAGAT
jgi:putative DNA base modification enzyme with NMAD domain